MRERGHLFIPILIILVVMYSGYSAPLAALARHARLLPGRGAAQVDARLRHAGRHLIEAFVDGAKNALGGRDRLRLRRHRDRRS